MDGLEVGEGFSVVIDFNIKTRSLKESFSTNDCEDQELTIQLKSFILYLRYFPQFSRSSVVGGFLTSTLM